MYHVKCIKRNLWDSKEVEIWFHLWNQNIICMMCPPVATQTATKRD